MPRQRKLQQQTNKTPKILLGQENLGDKAEILLKGLCCHLNDCYPCLVRYVKGEGFIVKSPPAKRSPNLPAS